MGTLVAIIDRSQKLRPHSKELYRHAAQLFEAFAPAERTWTPATVEAWRDSMVRGRKPQTVNRYLNGIRYASRRYEALGHGVDFADAAEECERQAERFDRSCAGAMRHCATYIRLAFADSGCYSFLDERKRLRAALAKVREDVNWMLNERKFLNADVFDYLDAALGEP